MRILLPVDLSERAREVVDLAIPWAERVGGVVDLLYVDETAIPLPHVKDAAVQKILEDQWSLSRRSHEAHSRKNCGITSRRTNCKTPRSAP